MSKNYQIFVMYLDELCNYIIPMFKPNYFSFFLPVTVTLGDIQITKMAWNIPLPSLKERENRRDRKRERAHGKILPLPVEKIGKIESLDLTCGCSNPFREQQGVLPSATYPAYVSQSTSFILWDPLNTNLYFISKQIFYSLLHYIYLKVAVTYSD